MKKVYYLFMLCALLVACGQVMNDNDANSISTASANNDFSVQGKKSVVYTTASDTDLRLENTASLEYKIERQPFEYEVSVFVNPKKTFQTFIGIGGSVTDASAEVFAKLPKAKQDEFLKAYYDVEEGIGYSLCRTPIHSCDFSSESYTYIEEGDKELKTFNIDYDRRYKIPMIKKAIAAAGGN